MNMMRRESDRREEASLPCRRRKGSQLISRVTKTGAIEEPMDLGILKMVRCRDSEEEMTLTSQVWNKLLRCFGDYEKNIATWVYEVCG